METPAQRIAFCVTGWHFPEDLYRTLRSTDDADIYVVCHRPERDLPPWLLALIPLEHVFLFPNIGYDWGCYQQFLETGAWRQYDVIFFMHDDITIRDLGFISKCVALLQGGARVVGNGLNSPRLEWPSTHPEAYVHSSWWPPSPESRHLTVRGSFFATTRETLERLARFEVCWDWMRINMKYGNWSLIATCGKMQALFGPDCFAFLSQDYCSSEWIVEHERGGAVIPPLPRWSREIYQFHVRLCRALMQDHFDGQGRLRERLARPLLWVLAGRGPLGWLTRRRRRHPRGASAPRGIQGETT